jgi:predicted alpha/beta superfamily hydrolase
MRYLCFCLCLFGCLLVKAQTYTVTFQLQLPAYHKSNSAVYLAGDFNNWNPADERFRTGTSAITINLPKGRYAYKFTRGSWQTVETGEGGTATENRELFLEKDTAIKISILHWSDHFPEMEKKSTASPNVSLLDTAFYMPQLNRYRRIWVYLPASYAASRKKYPVLYLHDGQNVFDDSTSFSGEWGVDEALDSMGLLIQECIVVAIDHGGEKRINEYSPYHMEKWGKGEGDAYVDFLVKTLMPRIRKTYRVKQGRTHRFIAGSSMGGLISFYALLRYPKTFGGAGVFSPAFWIAPQIKEVIPVKGRRIKSRIYFYAGKAESETMVPQMLQVFEPMNKHSKARMKTVIRTDGQHNEARWRQEFPLFYQWLLTSGNQR